VGLTAQDPLAHLGGASGVLGALVDGASLSAADAELVMDHVFDGHADPAQVAGFLVALRAKGETAEELTGMVRSMVAHAHRVELPVEAMDIVGTGGDGHHSVNISTMAALIVAGAGVTVCKHGNRAASSMVGTADVLEGLGVKIEMTPADVVRCVVEAGIGFCFAPAFHPAMRFVGPIRKALGIRTAFNFLGPLANPARPTRLLVGTSDSLMAERMATVLGANGITRAWVVNSNDGFDEFSLSAPSKVVEVLGDGQGSFELGRFTVDPTSMGFEPSGIDAVRGGDVAMNARAITDLLAGERGPIRDMAILNAAAALVVAEEAGTIEEGLDLAARSIDEGRAAHALESLAAASQG